MNVHFDKVHSNASMRSMLTLGEDFVEFEVDSQLSDIFFDNVNQKICTVRGNGAMGVTAKGLGQETWQAFRIRDGGKINTLNFSTDGSICCVQRKANSCDFVFLEDHPTKPVYDDYKQDCKNERAKIIGVQWVADKQIVYITDQGLELYQFNSKRKTVKFIKSVHFQPNWFVYYPASQLLICASGVTSSVLNPFVIQSGFIHKLPPFEVDFGCSRWKPRLLDRDVTVAALYGRLYLLTLKCGAREGRVDRIQLYLLHANSTDPPKLAFSLLLDLTNHVGVHLIDNLVVVHHKATCRSFVFDIGLQKTTVDRQPVAECQIEVAEKMRGAFPNQDLYNPAWVIFPPDLVADARFGIFATVRVAPEHAHLKIQDNMTLLDFVANRTNSTPLFLDTLKKMFLEKGLTIREAAEIFGRVLEQNNPGPERKSLDSAAKYTLTTTPFSPLKVDCNQVVRTVLVPLREAPEMDRHFLACLTLEFFLVLKKAKIPVEHHYLTELLVKTLVESGELEKLKQLLQYMVVDDSKFLAFELIALARTRPEFDQLALDMLQRKLSPDQIANFYLSQARVMDALRVLRAHPIDRPMALKVLETAWRSGCRRVQFAALTHLRDTRKLACFENAADDSQLAQYVRDFRQLFNEEEVLEADQRFRLAKISSMASLSGLNATPSRQISRRASANELDESLASSVDIDLNNAPGAGLM